MDILNQPEPRLHWPEAYAALTGLVVVIAIGVWVALKVFSPA